MKKDRDWVDLVNTVANVEQALQLSRINLKLAETSRRGELQRLEDASEARLREDIFQLEDDLEILFKHMQAHPRPALALALEIKRVMETKNITTARFPEYEDKAKVKKIQNGLGEVCEHCGARLTPNEKADVDNYLKFRAQMPALDRLIALATKTAELKNAKRQLDELATRKIELRLPLWYVGGLALGGIGVVGAVVCLIGLLEWDWSWVPLIFAVLLWIVGTVVNAERIKPESVAHREEIAPKLKALQDSVQQKTVELNSEIQAHAASLSSLRDQIGDLALAEYQRIKAERESFIDGVLAASATHSAVS